MAIPSEAKLDLSSESEADTRAIEFVCRFSQRLHQCNLLPLAWQYKQMSSYALSLCTEATDTPSCFAMMLGFTPS